MGKRGLEKVFAVEARSSWRRPLMVKVIVVKAIVVKVIVVKAIVVKAIVVKAIDRAERDLS